MLRPADEYVANFVKEVNRGRVVEVSAVMSPLRPGAAVSSFTVDASTTIEEAIRLLALAPDGDVTVVGQGSRPVGVVTFRQLAAAMVNSDVAQMSDDAVALVR